MNKKKLIVIASPSGGGKSTLARRLFKKFPDMQFSISATTRKKRHGETYGIEYFFLTKEDFEKRISRGELAEYEEIFGNYYGTLKSEIDKAIIGGFVLLFDIDVKGALSIREHYPDDSLLIFIVPPSVEELERRLRKRGTESDEQIANRLARGEMELSFADKFDHVIVNDNIDRAFVELSDLAEKYFDF